MKRVKQTEKTNHTTAGQEGNDRSDSDEIEEETPIHSSLIDERGNDGYSADDSEEGHKAEELKEVEEEEVVNLAEVAVPELDISLDAMLAFLKLDVTSAQLDAIWDIVDGQLTGALRGTGEKELPPLLKECVKLYVKELTCVLGERVYLAAIDRMDDVISSIGEQMRFRYLDALDNYGITDIEVIDKDDYLQSFVQYLCYPSPMEWHAHENKKVRILITDY